MATLATLRGFVRNMVLERTGDVGLVTDAEANDLINIAARSLFLRIVSKYPEVFAQRSAANVAIPVTGILPYGTITAGNIVRVLSAYVGVTGAAETAMDFCPPFEKTRDRRIYEPVSMPFGILTTLPILPYRWYIEGQNVIFTPLTRATYDARLAWVQRPTDMVADTDNAWGNVLTEYHDFIATLASLLVLAKDQNNPAAFQGFYQYVDQMVSDMFSLPFDAKADKP